MTKLKKVCPNCESKNIEVYSDYTVSYHTISCEDCPAGVTMGSLEQAKRAWNFLTKEKL